MKKLAKYTILFVLGVFFALGFVAMLFHAMEREDIMRDGIRKERCNNLPNGGVGTPLESYCAEVK